MSKKDTHDKSSLEKLNIENLFSSDGVKPHTNGKIDINTLFKKTDKKEDVDFDAYMLLNTVKKKKKKIIDCHHEIFRSCCETILSVDKSGLTDMIYEVPHFVPECPNYDAEACVDVLKNKIKEQKLSCLKINRTRLFITWNNLEDKLKSNSDE